MEIDIKARDINSRYMKKISIRPWWIVLLTLILCTGGIFWLFCGSITKNIYGYGYADYTTAMIYVPMDKSAEMDVGDKVWFDNTRGVIDEITEDEYLTGENMQESGFYQDFIDSGYFDETMTYVMATVIFESPVNNDGEYRIVTGTETPFEYLFGGDR